MRQIDKPVELLAPAGTWSALVAAIDAGANAVYLGGKHFNMRVHKNDFNFDDEMLKKAITYAHEHGVKIYITLNNLISNEELSSLKDYLIYLGEIKPDAILVQDFAVIKMIRDLKINVPMHASIMMNTHNVPAIKKLKEFGITRVVVSRELTLHEVNLLKQQTGIETEYFIHGDMCISESGQCIHSGIIFGQSGNRGRCLKPCRWSYELIDEDNKDVLDDSSYKFALKDMCMYHNIPELIHAGISSFKIEGRMRPPEFIHRIVSIYRRAIDSYLADSTGYVINDDDWQSLYENRARDFTTSCAFSSLTKDDIGITGEREPRFFSSAVIEPSFDDKSAADIFSSERPIKTASDKPKLSVRIATIDSAKAAIENGADVVYVGGEVFKPLRPWTLNDYENIIDFAHYHGKQIIINTPRTTYQRECNELERLFDSISKFKQKPDGVMVSNLGTLSLAKQFDFAQINTDISFNLFNYGAAEFLKENGAAQAAASLELSFTQLRSLVEQSALPIEVVIHGSYESMICDHNFPVMYLAFDSSNYYTELKHHYALKDEAGEIHSIRIDQYGRNHIYFAKDLCLYPYIKHFIGAASLRIDAQLYQADFVAFLTKIYRNAIDNEPSTDILNDLKSNTPRLLGIGVYRFRESRNSI